MARRSPAPVPGTPMGPGGTGSSMRQRFGWYFLGVALGLLFVGLLWQARYRTFQRMQQQQQQAAPGNAPGTVAPQANPASPTPTSPTAPAPAAPAPAAPAPTTGTP